MKQTEVGLIPDDWDVKRLGEVATLTSGESPSKFKFIDSGIPYYKVEQMNNSLKYQQATPFHIEKRVFVCRGSIIFPKRGAAIETNKVRILSQDSFFDTNIMAVTLNETVNNEYFYYWLVKKELWQIADTTSIPQINNKHIKPLLVPLPPLPEQQRIAKALSDVDALISTTEKLIRKKKNIKQGTMQNLLTGKKRLPGFGPQIKSLAYKQTELGPIPEDWEVKSLGEIAETFTGLTYSPENVAEHGTLVLRSSNIKNEQLCFEDNVFVQMSIPERAFVKENDILICVRNGSKALIGKSAIITKAAVGMAFGAFMTVLRSTIVNQNYLLYVWQSDFVQKQVTDNLGATINQITNADFKKFNVIITPNKEEQTAIANVLSSMDKEIETLNTKLEKYRNLKTAMMQQLLTGKIRLN